MAAKKASSKTPKASRPHMPGYGLPKSSKGLLSWKWAESKLNKSRQYWVITVRPDGRPHAMPVWDSGSMESFISAPGRRREKPKTWPTIPIAWSQMRMPPRPLSLKAEQKF